MRKIFAKSLLSKVGLALLLGCFVFLDSTGMAEPFQLVSVSDPAFSNANGGDNDSFSPIISPDGRYVLFASAANNLTLSGSSNAMPALSPPKMNVFLRDRTNGTTTLISVNLTGSGGGNADSVPVDISTNGQYALFESSADNLVAGDTNKLKDIFLRDLVHGTTLLVSVSTNGTSANGASRSSVMTPDGRYVVFVSEATNLVAGDTNGFADIFVRDMQSGVTTLASPGARGSGSSELPDITPDGHFVAFYSTATNLVGGISTVREIYIRDLVGGTTLLASGYAHTIVPAVYGTTNSLSFNLCISDDGQYLAYEAGSASGATNSGAILRYCKANGLTDVINTNAAGLMTGSELTRHTLDMTPDGRFIAFVGNTNGSSCIYVWDAQSGSATLASGNLSNAVPTNSTCDAPVMDASGRFVSFMFTGTGAGLTSNTVSTASHIYVRDMQAGLTTLVDADTNGIGSASNPMTFPRISADGSQVAFESYGKMLTTNNSNYFSDIYVSTVTNGAMELISIRQPALPSAGLIGPSTLSTFSVSTNGRFIAFASEANNVTPQDTNGFRDVFVRDTLIGSNFLVSVDANGIFSGNGISMDSAISGNGRYVAFTSNATNLVAGDFNAAKDVFMRDLQSGTTALVSMTTNAAGSGNADSTSPMISVDGRYVLFHSKASNLASGIPATNYDNVFVRDLQTGRTLALAYILNSSLAAGALTPDGHYAVVGGLNVNLNIWNLQTTNIIYTNTTKSASYAGISPNGSRIGFVVMGTTGHVYAADRMSNTTATLSSAPSTSHVGLRFSGDSRYMVYVGADVSKTNQVYLYDFQTGSNLLVSANVNLTGGGNGHSDSPDISSDGRFVAYRSVANNIVPGVSNGLPNVYLFDRV